MKKLFEKKESETVEMINTLITENDEIILEHIVKGKKKDKVLDQMTFTAQEARVLIAALEKAVSSLGEEPDLIATL